MDGFAFGIHGFDFDTEAVNGFGVVKADAEAVAGFNRMPIESDLVGGEGDDLVIADDGGAVQAAAHGSKVGAFAGVDADIDGGFLVGDGKGGQLGGLGAAGLRFIGLLLKCYLSEVAGGPSGR